MSVTLLKEEQVWGDDALNVLKEYGTKTGITDLAVLQGTMMGETSTTTSDGGRSALVWSASSDGCFVRVVN